MALVISTEYWTGSYQRAELFTKVTLEILGQVLDASGVSIVYLWDHHGGYYPPHVRELKGAFVVNINATAKPDTVSLPAPKLMWSFEVYRMPKGLLEPSGKGFAIVEPISGNAVAELIGNELFLLFDASDYESLRLFASADIYRRILEATVPLLDGRLPKLSELLAGTFKEPQARLLRLMSCEVKEHKQEILRHVAHATALEAQLGQLGSQAADRAIEALHGIPEVKSLALQGGRLVIHTHLMYAIHPRDKDRIYEFGEFRIELTFGPGATASFTNLTRRVTETWKGDPDSRFGHPHVDRAGGEWCQGEGVEIQKLLRDFEFEAALLFALKAIESINRQETYTVILEKFPRVSERMEYLRKTTGLDDDLRHAFALLFKESSADAQKKFTHDIGAAKLAISSRQGQLLRGTLAATMAVTTKVTDKVRAQLALIRARPDISDVAVKDDILRVATGPKASVGRLVMEFDFGTGLVRYHDKKHRRPNADGELPLGQLSATLPELLGSLELETAVSLALEFLKTTVG